MTSDFPDLSGEYALSQEEVASFRRDGHVLLRGVASADKVAAYRRPIAALVEQAARDRLPLDQRDTYHKAFVQIANLWETDEGVRRFTLAPRFGRIAAKLLGVDGVRIWHDQALFKEAGGGPTPWHQDQYYWPLDSPNTVTMWMPLVDVPVEMGVLTFATGSHTDGPLCSMAISDESDDFYERAVRERKFPIRRDAMKAGDATFHTGWTVHMAPGNRTDRCREVMTVIYMADGIRVTEPANRHQPADLARWLPGLKPGDLAASPLNPLVYGR
jgi:ectoine hydroxylase-related dioxygenase (phytanoyl-CoA dioxygenase family)